MSSDPRITRITRVATIKRQTMGCPWLSAAGRGPCMARA